MDAQFLEKERLINERMMNDTLYSSEEKYGTEYGLQSENEHLIKNTYSEVKKNDNTKMYLDYKDRQGKLDEKTQTKNAKKSKKIMETNRTANKFTYQIMSDSEDLIKKQKKEAKIQSDLREDTEKVRKYMANSFKRFTPEYIAYNYQEAKRELDFITKYAKMCKDGTASGGAFVNRENNFGFEELAEKCQEAFVSALAVNGLKFERGLTGKLVPISVEEQQDAKRWNQVKQAEIDEMFLRGHKAVVSKVEQQEAGIFAEWTEVQYQKLFIDKNIEASMERMNSLAQKGMNAGDVLTNNLTDEYKQLSYMLTIREHKLEQMKQYRDKAETSGAEKKVADARIAELKKYIMRLQREKDMIESILKDKANECELNDEQKEYMQFTYGVGGEELKEKILSKCKNYVQARKDKIKNYATVEETKRKVEELYRILNGNMKKMELIEWNEELSGLVEEIQQNLQLEELSEVERFKALKVILFAKKSRQAMLLTACKYGTISEEHLTEAEKRQILAMSGDEQIITLDNVRKYARRQHNIAQSTLVKERQKFYDIKKIKRTIRDFDISEEMKKEKTERGMKSSFSDFYKMFRVTTSGSIEIEDKDKWKSKAEEAEFEKIVQRLQKGHYKISGDDKDYLRENLFRSVDTYVGLSGFEAMGTTGMLDMAKELSAEDKTENMSGLRKMKEAGIQSISDMYKKYGIECPDVDVLYLELDNIMQDCMGGFLQIFINAYKVPGLFDMDDPKEKLLFKIAEFYYAYGFGLLAPLQQMKDEATEGEFEQYVKEIWSRSMLKYVNEVKTCNLSLIK